MTKVKVFLPTYRRNNTLKRSVNSLLDQSYTNWICEVHNDDPLDTFPIEYINSLNDDRFKLVTHSQNLGPVATFNKMFDATECEYICLLEDDNWWEKNFLETMCAEMHKHPECNIGFSNIYLWQEKLNDQWEKLPLTLWPDEKEKYKLITFPQPRHIFHYHHSSCSIIIRNSATIANYIVPGNTRFDFIEPVRERAFPHPLLFINLPLANFALTNTTSRPKTIAGIYEHYLLLIDSFFKCIETDDEYIKYLWDDARKSNLLSYNKLLYTGLICKASRKLLKHATIKEWVVFLLYNIKHPTVFMNCVKAKKNYAVLWEYLLTNTQNQFLISNHKQEII